MKSAVTPPCKNHSTVLRQATTNTGRGYPSYSSCSVARQFRLILRCRQLARDRFAKMRADVLVKLELLDQKHGALSSLSSTPNSLFHSCHRL